MRKETFREFPPENSDFGSGTWIRTRKSLQKYAIFQQISESPSGDRLGGGGWSLKRTLLLYT